MVEALVIASWMMPALLVGMALLGYIHGHNLKISRHSATKEMIIQITTIGNHKLVNTILRTIRDYKLPFPYRIWVVTEPGSEEGYLGADRVIVVPKHFTCRAGYKARALEYSRLLRKEATLDREDVKVLFLDDDTIPTEGFILKAFRADYDLCQGITIPRNGYGRLLSHMDDLRTLNCLMFCSVFQGYGQPLFVHGEGLCVRASAEQIVTWNYSVFASEDFVFGQIATAKGLRWGFFYDYIYITSPWSWRDFLKQRRRWTWGNIHAVLYIVSLKAKVLIVAKHIQGIVTFLLSSIGIVLDLTGVIDIPDFLRPLLFATFLLFIGSFALSGYINSGGSIKQAAISAVLAWVTSAVNIIILLLGIALGNPRRFEVIEKVRGSDIEPDQKSAPTGASRKRLRPLK